MPYMASLTIMDINDYKKDALEFWDYYMDSYGIEPNFKTYVDNQAVATSKEHVKEKFEFYKMGWSLIGKDVSNAQEVYDAFFNEDDIKHIPTTDEVIQENNEIIKHAKSSDYIEFQEMRREIRKKSIVQTVFISILLIIVSLVLSWYIVSPDSLLYYILFLMLGLVFFYILGWLFNFLWDLFK